MKSWIGVIGYPLGQSLSRQVHEANLLRAKLDWEFRLLEMKPELFERSIEELKKDSNCVGFSVTMPYKQKILPFIDRADETVTSTGVVNCIVNDKGKWAGFNTDHDGFLEGFKYWNPLPPKNNPVVFLGAGATAQTLSIALAGQGFHSFTFMNRDPLRAERCMAFLKKAFPTVKVSLYALGKPWGAALPSKDCFILNTTPLGMPLGLDLSHLKPPIWIFDVAYNPSETDLLQSGRRRCFYTMNGVSMFEHQAQSAFNLWVSKDL